MGSVELVGLVGLLGSVGSVESLGCWAGLVYGIGHSDRLSRWGYLAKFYQSQIQSDSLLV